MKAAPFVSGAVCHQDLPGGGPSPLWRRGSLPELTQNNARMSLRLLTGCVSVGWEPVTLTRRGRDRWI